MLEHILIRILQLMFGGGSNISITNPLPVVGI